MQSLIVDGLAEIYHKRIRCLPKKTTKTCTKEFRNIMEEFNKSQQRFHKHGQKSETRFTLSDEILAETILD